MSIFSHFYKVNFGASLVEVPEMCYTVFKMSSGNSPSYSSPNSVEDLISSIKNYRLPIIVGLIGTAFIIGSIILLAKQQPKSEITFIQNPGGQKNLSVKAKLKADIEGGVINPGVYEMTMGSRVEDLLVKTTVFLQNLDDYGKVNEIYGKYFHSPYPARSAVQISRLPREALIEIEAVAKLKKDKDCNDCPDCCGNC